MTNWLTEFPPTRVAAQQRLHDFAPKSAAAYAKTRNFDLGPGRHSGVSTLSPYIKSRALDEIAVLRAALDIHGPKEIEKFAAEVFWRSYWKGWMELRPDVWAEYQREIRSLQNEVQTQSGLRNRWEDACLGKTGIAPFDAWALELVATGYLHNHARMWFASIWIFTLRLPWQLGADFFLRHLLDGDAAVNTLSWRWVAGIQTPGKTYLARPDNIATFTGGRFRDVAGLATEAPAIGASPPPPVRTLPACAPLPLKQRIGVLIHEDDMDLLPLLAEGAAPVTVAYAEATANQSPWAIAPHVTTFRQALAHDMARNMARDMAQSEPDQAGRISTAAVLQTTQDIADWAGIHRLDQIIAPYAPVGPSHDLVERYIARPDACEVSLVRRPLDTAAWPLATKGFFPFRKHIPALIDRFVQN